MNRDARWTELLEEVALQRQCLDMMNGGWIGEYSARGGVIYCARGCHGCCSLTVNCTLTEAVALAEVLDEAQLAAVHAYAGRLRELAATVGDMKGYLQMQRRDMGMCPLLAHDGACGVYGSRPLTCRSLLSTKERYWCAVDFATIPPDEKAQYIASLDRSVAAFPLHYVASAQETGRELETRQLAHMQELFGFSCYGCMPVLVALVHGHGLAAAATREQAERLVSGAGFANPLLVSMLP
ncbi:MAG TPA: YkgJ family cysteine cluster protein [Desulfuromonadaceae bacterium]